MEKIVCFVISLTYAHRAEIQPSNFSLYADTPTQYMRHDPTQRANIAEVSLSKASGQQDVPPNSTMQYPKRHAFHISNQTNADPIPT